MENVNLKLSCSPLPLAFVASIILTVLKLTQHIDVSWFWVASPVIFVGGCGTLAFVAFIGFTLLGALLE